MKPYASYSNEDHWRAEGIAQNPFYVREVDIIRTEIGSSVVSSALDLGCGYGRASSRLGPASKTWIGLDGSMPMLNRHKNGNPSALLVKADIDSHWPMRSGSFDVIVGLQIVNHASDLRFFFREIHRLLKSDGKAYLSVGNSRSFAALLHGKARLSLHGFRRYCPSEIESHAKAEGLWSRLIGGSGLLSPIRRFFFFEALNILPLTHRFSHLMVYAFGKLE